jgi:hypothetical protein
VGSNLQNLCWVKYLLNALGLRVSGLGDVSRVSQATSETVGVPGVGFLSLFFS